METTTETTTTTETPPAATEGEQTSEATETQDQTEGATETGSSESDSKPTSTPPEGDDKAEAGELLEALEGKLVRVKIDGVEKNMKLSEVIARMQRGAGAEKRMGEAAKVRKHAENLIRAMQKDPIAVMKHPALGFTEEQVDKMLEEAIYEKVQYEQMTPEQKELFKAKKALAQNEEDKKRAAAEKKEAEIRELTGKYREHFQGAIIEALEEAKLPKTTGTVRRMAHYLLEGNKRGVRFEPKDVVDLVRGDINKEFKEMFSESPAENLLGILGDSVAEKIRKHDLSKVSRGNEGAQVVDAKGVEDAPPKKITKEEWKKLIADRAR
jgi:hypothetical protein